MNDELVIGGVSFTSRFILGSGKTSRYTPELINSAVEYARTEMISVAIDTLDDIDNGIKFIPDNIRILPNTLGARSAQEAVTMAHLAQSRGLGNFIKIEILEDTTYLLPNNPETVNATERLAAEGFIVLPYIYPDLKAGRQLEAAGAAAIMPLASPSGSNKGLATRDFIEQLINEINLPIIVDAGIARPSQACEAMEMGCDAVMANTALASANNLPMMASAFRHAIQAGREAYLSKKFSEEEGHCLQDSRGVIL